MLGRILQIPLIVILLVGIAEKIFVITVAPQKLICPQGSTYPRKAVIIAKVF